MTKRQLAALYRAAAKKVEQGRQDFSCCAITSVEPGEPRIADSLAAHSYLNTFSPQWQREGTWDKAYALQFAIELDPAEVRDLRVMLLCMMAAITAAGDLP